MTDNNDPDDLGRVKATVQQLLDAEATGWALPAFIYGGLSEQGFFAVPDVGAGVWIEFERGDLSYPIWSGTWYTSGSYRSPRSRRRKSSRRKAAISLIFDDDAGTMEITDSNGNTIKMEQSQITISASSATSIVIDAPEIDLVSGASHPLVFGDALLQYLNQIVQMFNTHMHPGEMASTFPVTPQLPVPTLSPPSSSLLSMKVNTG